MYRGYPFCARKCLPTMSGVFNLETELYLTETIDHIVVDTQRPCCLEKQQQNRQAL